MADTFDINNYLSPEAKQNVVDEERRLLAIQVFKETLRKEQVIAADNADVADEVAAIDASIAEVQEKIQATDAIKTAVDAEVDAKTAAADALAEVAVVVP